MLYAREGTDISMTGERLDVPLKPCTAYVVRIHVTGAAGEGRFETGKMDDPWAAEWIGPGKDDPCHPAIRRTVQVKPGLRRARLYAAGVGLFEAYVNGKKLGREYLLPGITNYETRIQAITFPAEGLHEGDNELSFLLGKGWYMGVFGLDNEEKNYGGRMAVIGELHLTYGDGTREVITTPAGEAVLDFGQNFAGFPEFDACFPAGTKITLDFGEILQQGDLYRDNYRDARSRFEYTSGVERETLRPRFTSFSFRYVKVTGWPGAVPNYVPNIGHKRDAASAWGDIATFLPMAVWNSFGDKSELAWAYPMMTGWVDYMDRLDAAHGERRYTFEPGFQFGDWLGLDEPSETSCKGGTDDHYLGAAYYYQSAKLTAQAAEILGHAGDAAHYGALAENIKAGMLNEYFTPSGRFALDTQAAYVVALKSGLWIDRKRLVSQFVGRLKKTASASAAASWARPCCAPCWRRTGWQGWPTTPCSGRGSPAGCTAWSWGPPPSGSGGTRWDRTARSPAPG